MNRTLETIIDPFKDMPGMPRGQILKTFESRYQLIREKIKWGACTYGKDYIVHIRLPSESPHCPDVYYDVIFDFFPESKNVEESNSITKYSVRMWSNCPSFTFSFTYSYNQVDWIIPWMKDKCNQVCLNRAAVIRNPTNYLGVDMKTWLAAYHIKYIGLLSYKPKFMNMCNTNVDWIHAHVLSQDQMLVVRQRADRQYRERVKNEKALDRQNSRFNDYRHKKDLEHRVQQVSGNKVNSAKFVNSVKSVAARHAKSARSARHARRAR